MPYYGYESQLVDEYDMYATEDVAIFVAAGYDDEGYEIEDEFDPF